MVKFAKFFGTVATVVAASAVTATSAVAQNIAIDGSSTVFPITEAMAEEYALAGNPASITIGVSGTGGGFKKFCAGETAISNASRPIKDTEKELCAANGIEYIAVPVAYDALTVVINPENDWATEMTVAQLNTMWDAPAEGTITRWNQIDPSWPDEEISLFGPGTDSGTFDYFTDEVNGDGGVSRADYTASEDDNILVRGVAGDKYAIGYFGLAYFAENSDILQSVSILNEELGEYVEPTVENVEADIYQPLGRPIFIYVNAAALTDADSGVADFVQFYIEQADAGELILDVGYVPLPDAATDATLEAYDAEANTIFN
ncbi:PstS family phosphate ABC transporter substrate-binding protein [Leptothoe sp. ISB3NOV94-8A]|uniref:Phosphate-binding protein n=1 Tax=Adonisia turfae CCMR0081 TaxID=2292702 RepID=A0A6M0RUC3_9CYAN|nr:PstS family phosphate ABC transporter substrate-binding protein [Adonisia turfae]MDV3347506.1 PstS family phosphate ABC transporter substrate-binding protein [Leptothoe sp. LEGE 181152]NEZ59341.1 PstS family phosphate ABC transporter substrate-binding protein [Adonisia turfae CCMR0081]